MRKNRLLWLTVLCFIALCLGGSWGCTGPGLLSGVAGDMKEILKEPVVQATLQSWAAKADVTNPCIEFYFINGAGLRAPGFILRGDISGSGTPGIDPALYKTLVDIAKERGYEPPPPAEGGSEGTGQQMEGEGGAAAPPVLLPPPSDPLTGSSP